MPDSPSPRPVGPYTPVVRAGEWLVVSGQLGLLDGALVAGGVAGQTAQAVANLAGLLAAEGASLRDVVKTTVFLARIDDYPAMNDAYTAAFGEHRPARSAVAVAGLPLGAEVEIEAWARISQDAGAPRRGPAPRPADTLGGPMPRRAGGAPGRTA